MGRPVVFLLLALSVLAFTDAQRKSRRKPSGQRIVGGEETKIEDFPYQVSIEMYGQHFCGGSIISATKILSAAHCFEGVNPGDLLVRVGSSYREKGGTTYEVKSIKDHENYNNKNFDNDISVLTLKYPIRSSSGGKPVKVAKQSPKSGSDILVSGWGVTTEGGQGALKLRKVTVPVMSNSKCNEKYGAGRITDAMMCAGLSEGGKDACQEDSGGPAVDANRSQVGVVSFGAGCARPGAPGVYARVANFASWIEKQMKN